MFFSKFFYEMFEKNFRAMSEHFEDSIHQIAKVYNGLHMSHPFFSNPFFKQETHEKEHLHSQGAKTEKSVNRKTP